MQATYVRQLMATVSIMINQRQPSYESFSDLPSCIQWILRSSTMTRIQQHSSFAMSKKISLIGSVKTWTTTHQKSLHIGSLLPCWSMLPLNLKRDKQQQFYTPMGPRARRCEESGRYMGIFKSNPLSTYFESLI